MTNSMQALKEVIPFLERKFPNGKILKPFYHKNGDIYNTVHQYTLTVRISETKSLSINLFTTFIPYGGADYKIEIVLSTNNKDQSFAKYWDKKEITAEGILETLREKGLKI